MGFFETRLRPFWDQGIFTCLGLDSAFEKLPTHLRGSDSDVFKKDREEAIFTFNQSVIAATQGLVCAVKPNVAFYQDPQGSAVRALQRTFKYIRSLRNPDKPPVFAILDAKRGDIGPTNQGYVIEAFEKFEADAVTVSYYFGHQAMAPFLERADRGIIILCRTSNPGADRIQNRFVEVPEAELKELMPDFSRHVGLELGWKMPDMTTILVPFYQFAALDVARNWNRNENCALVVGATAPRELEAVRRLVPHMTILAPGVGKQGARIEDIVPRGLDACGGGLIINAGSKELFASSGTDFAAATQRGIIAMNEEIQHRLNR